MRVSLSNVMPFMALGLVRLVDAQVSSYSAGTKDLSYKVNVPSSTSSSGSGPIYIQMSGSSSLEWFALGQGTQMAGANIMVVYAASSTNVTLSPRLGKGHVQPLHNSDAQVTLLDGTGISNGIMTANIRCDTCTSWSGGSMNVDDSSSNWIFSYKTGSALDTTDTSASITQHDSEGTFNFDLTQATGGDSSNPFVDSTSTSTSTTTGSASSTSSTSSTSSDYPGSSSSSSYPGSSGSSGSSSTSFRSPDHTIRVAHATIMSLVFVLLFPLFALTIYLPITNKVRYIHAPLQLLALALAVAGLGCGVQLAKENGNVYSGYHPVIGYIAVSYLLVVQPITGLVQHLHFRRTSTRSPAGNVHRWLGRLIILLGIINGGLGFKFTGPVGSPNVPRWAVILYSVVAAVVALVW